jgi:hypothetical protein
LIPQGDSTLRIVNLPGAGAHGGMRMHLLTRNRRPRALMEASGIVLRCGPTFHFGTFVSDCFQILFPHAGRRDIDADQSRALDCIRD